jgi:ATP-dependent protease HslVU (ClpYQ) peptidase subunit
MEGTFMTIIAAYKGPDGIYLGGDSMAADANDVVYLTSPKVFRLPGFTVGFAGSFRFGQILEHCFDPPEHPYNMDDFTYMFAGWTEKLRETLANYGLLKSENGVDSIGEDGAALLIYNEGIYQIQEDLSILKISSNYASIGVGMNYALGVMHALDGSGLTGEEIVKRALDIAIYHCPRCGGDTTILKHEPMPLVLKVIKPRKTRAKK